MAKLKDMVGDSMAALKHNKMGMVCTANLGPNRNNSNVIKMLFFLVFYNSI